jgi:hypothetical protein
MSSIEVVLPESSVGSYWYIASPYTAFTRGGKKPTDRVMHARAEQVAVYAGILLNGGEVVYCPIAHGHFIQQRFKLPMTWEFWWKIDKVFLGQAQGLIVYQMDGWNRSRGVADEIKFAVETHKPITYVDPDTIQIPK